MRLFIFILAITMIVGLTACGQSNSSVNQIQNVANELENASGLEDVNIGNVLDVLDSLSPSNNEENSHFKVDFSDISFYTFEIDGVRFQMNDQVKKLNQLDIYMRTISCDDPFDPHELQTNMRVAHYPGGTPIMTNGLFDIAIYNPNNEAVAVNEALIVGLDVFWLRFEEHDMTFSGPRGLTFGWTQDEVISAFGRDPSIHETDPHATWYYRTGGTEQNIVLVLHFFDYEVNQIAFTFITEEMSPGRWMHFDF
jgi:hypothetical protein